MRKKTKEIPMLMVTETTEYWFFYSKWKGYEFRQKGFLIPKHEVFLQHGLKESYDLEYTVTNKPGWDDGELKHPSLFDEYLSKIKYN